MPVPPASPTTPATPDDAGDRRRASRRRRAPRLATALLAVALLVPVAAPSDARAPNGGNGAGTSEVGTENREYQVKAALLLNFIRYTTWPADSFERPDSPVVVSVVGTDPFGDVLEETFEGEQANGRPIAVGRSRDVPAEVRAHVVFCAGLDGAARAELLARCRKRPALLVGETPGFAEDGACVNFYLSEKKIRFEVNTEALAEGSLVMSPAVLKLAKIVKTRREEG